MYLCRIRGDRTSVVSPILSLKILRYYLASLSNMSPPIKQNEKADLDIGRTEDTSSSLSPELHKIDTIHNDEALKVLANYRGEQTWTDKEEKKLPRKIDWKLMPVLCATYGLQYYDKAMLSQAVSVLFNGSETKY